MEAWRRVEVAACEEMPGPTADDLEAIRAATFTVEAVKEREAVTDHDVAAFVDVLSASAGPGGRYVDVLGQSRLGQHLPGMRHQVTQQAKFDARQRVFGAIFGVHNL